MQTHLNIRNRVSKAIGLLLLPLALIACGGGADTNPNTGTNVNANTTATAAITPAIEVVGSNGDMTKYANANWVSDCGVSPSTAAGSTPTSSIINLEFGTVTASTVDGTLTRSLFSGTTCAGNTIDLRQGVLQATYKTNIAVTSDTPATVQGTADELLLTSVSSGDTVTFTVGFLPGYGKFLSGTGSRFTSLSLPYTKH
jgi:hypothetical protein